jgi:hypothetical protein
MKQYMAQYMELNNALRRFPPGNDQANQMLPEDEIIEHAEAAIPNTWKQQMFLQNFDPLEHTLQELVEFCQRMEMAEDIQQDVFKKGQTATDQKGGKGDGSSLNRSNGKRKTAEKHCMYHGNNTTHDTSDCKVLKAQADKMRAQREANPPPNKRTKYNDNKWKRENNKSDNTNGSNNQKELYSLMEKLTNKVEALEEANRKRPAGEAFNIEEEIMDDIDNDFNIGTNETVE